MKKIEVFSEGIHYIFESKTALSFRVGVSGGGTMMSNEYAGALYISDNIPDSNMWKIIAIFKSWESVQERG